MLCIWNVLSLSKERDIRKIRNWKCKIILQSKPEGAREAGTPRLRRLQYEENFTGAESEEVEAKANCRKKISISVVMEAKDLTGSYRQGVNK